MAKNNSGKSEQKEVGQMPMFDPAEFTKFGTRNLEVATRAARAYYNGMSKLNREMMNFVNARVKKDMETARSFMTSKNTESAFHTQAEFLEGAIRDYADETSKIMHMAADMAHDTLAPVEERAEEMLHDFDDRAEVIKQKPAAE
ncbi:MAG: phasin family protein [Pseudomonadota bacterium]